MKPPKRRTREDWSCIHPGAVATVILLATGLACGGQVFGPHGNSPGTGGAGPIGSGGNGGAAYPTDAQSDVRSPDAVMDAPVAREALPDLASAPDFRPSDSAQAAPDVRLEAGLAVPDATPEIATRSTGRTLSLVVKGAPWSASQATQGMAVDGSGRVYVGDHSNVYAVDGSVISMYLTGAEAGGAMTQVNLGDLDIGPDGRLYLALSGFVANKGSTTGIVRSSQPHQAEWWMDLSGVGQPMNLSVLGDGFVAVIAQDGLWTVTADGGRKVYTSTALQWTSSCACQDLAGDPSGVFLYQPGCNGSPLLRGNANGSGVGVLYSTWVSPPTVLSAHNFLCVGRDPTGGFVVVVDDDSGGSPRLYHVADNAEGSSGLQLIDTEPSFAEARTSASNTDTFGFRYCSVAAAPDGTVYFQTYSQLWKVSPP